MATQRELLSHYRSEIRRSRRWRSGTGDSFDDDWRRFIDLYQGRHYDKRSGADQLTVNMVFATINVMNPAVAINNPRFVVSARDPQSSVQAVLTEEVLNFLWRSHKFQREFRMAVQDFLICGHGWLKVGYKTVKPPEAKTIEWDQDTPDMTEGEKAAQEGIDDQEDTEGNVESEMIFDEVDRPFLERISIFDMFVDPDARDPEEMRWIAQRVWRPAPDVRVDSRYSATARKRIESSNWSRYSDTRDGDGRTGHDEMRRQPDRDEGGFVEVIEFYDLRRKTVSTFALEGEDDTGFLIRPKQMPYAFGHPFTMIRNYEVPDNFYPIGDVAQIESLQLELNETRNQMLNYRKQYRRAMAYNKDLVDQAGVQAWQSGEDNVAIPVKGDENPSNAFAPLPTIAIPPEFFDQSGMISIDMDRVSGVSDYQRGGNLEMKRTATEAAMIQDAANARAQDRLAKIEGTMAELAERIIKLMQQYLTGEHVARIVTIPVDGWINYDREHLMGSFDFEVMGGSTEPRNESFRAQRAIQMADISIPFMDAGVVNVPALYQELLQKGFGMKDASRLVQLPPPPQDAMVPPEQAPPEPPMGPPQPPMGGPEQMGGPMELTPEMWSLMNQGQQPVLPQ